MQATGGRHAHLPTDRAGDGSCAAKVDRVRLARLDIHHQVGHRVRHHHRLALQPLFAGDFQHFILDRVTHVERFEQQHQGILQLDALHIDRNRSADGETLIRQARFVEHDVHVGNCGNVRDHLLERCVLEGERDRPCQTAFNPLLFRRANAHVGAELASATLRDGVPILTELDGHAVVKRDRGVFDTVERVPEASLFRILQLVIAVIAAGDDRFQNQHLRDRIIRIELLRLFGDDFRLGVPLLFHQFVELFHEVGELFFDSDLRVAVTSDAFLDLVIVFRLNDVRLHLLLEAVDLCTSLPQCRGQRGGDLLLQGRAFDVGHRLVENFDRLGRVFFTQPVGAEDGIEHFAAQPIDLHFLSLGSDIQRTLWFNRIRLA